MEIVRESSTNCQTEITPLARRRLANVAFDLEKAEYTRAVPVEAISSQFSDIEQGLKEKIVGQEEAISKLTSSLETAELRNPKRPVASFIFLGPTGVGKSETAKELASLLHNGKETAFLQIDCGEFSDFSSVTTLLGAAPEYVGREQAPLLDPKIIEQDKSVILFDEIEKGHPKLHDLLLQILDEGRVTLHNGGQTVSFRNSIIIMTSNVGSSEIMQKASGKQIGFKTTEPRMPSKKSIDDAAYNALKAKFRPEFINRIDHRITYGPLSDEQLCEVLDNYVYELTQSPALTKRNIGLTLAPDVISTIVNQTPNREELGARPVLRRFEQTVWSNYTRSITGRSIPDNSWAYALLAENETEGAEIPVEFFYKAVPPRPMPSGVTPIVAVDVQEITESETIVS